MNDHTPHPRPFWSHVKSLFGARNDATIKEAIEEAIDEVLEDREAEAAAMAPEEKNMLKNVLTFGDITVRDIMTPRSNIVGVPSDITLEALKRHIIEERHTRIPVYNGSLDQLEGFVHIKDLFAVSAGDQPYELGRIMWPLLFVPPSMRVLDLLVKMRHSGVHMAIVVDEHGGTDGLVTLEDVFEEIVGEIQDEHDDEMGEHEVVRLGMGAFEADARIRIDRLEKELQVGLQTGEDEQAFDTLGGLIFFQLGRVPSRGEVVQHASGLRFEILEADPRRIKRVKIMRAAV